jgi:hypothetical protein
VGTFTTAARTVSVGSVNTATGNNTYERDFIEAFGAMDSYTPSWTASSSNPSLGNGTLLGAYTQVGKSVWFRVLLTTGSTTTYGSGAWRFSLPVTATGVLSGAGGDVGGAACYDDSGALRRFRHVYLAATTYVSLADDDGTLVAATVPFTWATGDTLSIHGWFEAA